MGSCNAMDDAVERALLLSLLGGQAPAEGLDLTGLLAGQLGGSSGTPDLMQMLSGQAGAADAESTRLNLVLRWLEQQRVAEAEAAVLEQEQDTDWQRLDDIQELHNLTDALYAELDVLRARNVILAAALGACPRCFGTDPDCPEDHDTGTGGPGTFLPDAATFREWIAPAVRRVRAEYRPAPRRKKPRHPPAANGTDDSFSVGI
jgi:hypothetical protein